MAPSGLARLEQISTNQIGDGTVAILSGDYFRIPDRGSGNENGKTTIVGVFTDIVLTLRGRFGLEKKEDRVDSPFMLLRKDAPSPISLTVKAPYPNPINMKRENGDTILDIGNLATVSLVGAFRMTPCR